MNQGPYTTEEIAQLLKISKLTVYDLIKKGKLPAYRVGKQMRIDADDLESYKKTNKMTDPSSATSPSQTERPIVISGQDICLDILGRYLDKKKEWRPLRSYHGSLNSLISMYRNECDLVSVHLFDGETGTYNLPYVKRVLTGRSYLVVHLLKRQAGFYVQKDNPKNLTSWTDLSRNDLTIVNREKGSGARVLLDEQLIAHGIDYQQLNGYQHEESTHLSVASLIKQEQADVGIGIEKAALTVGTDFIPLTEERYDLVLLKTDENKQLIDDVLTILQSPSFKQELDRLGGYVTDETGTILHQN